MRKINPALDRASERKVTPAVRLRAVEPSDAEWMREMENDESIRLFSATLAPMSVELLRQYALTYDADPFSAGQLRLMVENDEGHTVGIADLYDIDRMNMRAFAAIAIAPKQRRRGYALAAIKALTAYATEELGLNSVSATITIDNKASLELFRKAGFTPIGILPRWYRRGRTFIDSYLLTFLTTP